MDLTFNDNIHKQPKKPRRLWAATIKGIIICTRGLQAHSNAHYVASAITAGLSWSITWAPVIPPDGTGYTTA